MLTLPVTDAFKRGILNGQGEIEVKVDPSLASVLRPDDPFPESAHSLAIVGVSGKPPKLTFGGDGAVSGTASFSGAVSAGVEVIHPNEQSQFLTAYLPDFVVPQGSLALRFFTKADGQVAVEGSVPTIAGLTFGVNAGGNVLFSRLITVAAVTPARSALLRVFSDVRLPQRRGTPGEIPAAGEAVVFEYGGFLDLKAGLTWGYALTGTESLEAGRIEASLAYDVRLKAAVSLGYKLAGDFVMVARAADRPGWVRLSVHKKRDSTFSFAAGFALNADVKLDFAAETVDDVLIAFFGADARRALALFDEFQTFTDLDALEERAGKVLFSSLQKLSHKWIGRALDQTALGSFVKVLGKVVEQYKGLDQKILDLYEDFLRRSKLTELRSILERISGLKRKEDLTTIGDSEVFATIRRLAESEIFSLIESNEAFATVIGRARSALAFLDGSELKDLIDALEEDLRLDEIFGRLEKMSSKEGILSLTDQKLQGVVERVVGKTFDEIRKSNLDETLKELQKTLARINTFRQEMIANLEKALQRSFSMEVNYAYTRSSSDQALLDMDFDVGTARGAALFDLAARGKVADVMNEADLGVVRVRQAALTHKLTSSSQLQINFVGWKLGRLVELVSDTTISLETHDGGLVQMFTSTESVKQRREHGRSAKEISQTVFMLTRAGQTTRPTTTTEDKQQQYVIKTLNRMSAGYDAMQLDEKTSLDELYEYLVLARWLELISPSPTDPSPLPFAAVPGAVPSVDAFIDSLKSEFPKGFGKVTARYVVRYDDDTVADAFKATSGDDLERRIRLSCRRIIGGHLVTPRQSLMHIALGLAYAHDGTARTVFEEQGFNPISSQTFTVTLPKFLGKPLAGRKEALKPDLGSIFLSRLFAIEQELCRRLRKLDDKIDKARVAKEPVLVSEISDAARSVLKSAADVDDFGGVNAFFGVMDDLIQQGRAGKGRRMSSLILDIEPPTGQKITKFLMTGAPQ